MPLEGGWRTARKSPSRRRTPDGLTQAQTSSLQGPWSRYTALIPPHADASTFRAALLAAISTVRVSLPSTNFPIYNYLRIQLNRWEDDDHLVAILDRVSARARD